MAHNGLVEGQVILIIIEVVKIIHGVILIHLATLGPMMVLKWSPVSKMVLHSVKSAHFCLVLVSGMVHTPLLRGRKLRFASR